MGQPEDDDHTGDQYHEHMNVIADAITRWRNGAISTWKKRKLIVDENQRYYGASRKSPITGESIALMPRVADPAAVIADITGLAQEAVTAALDARRNANVMARQILDDGGAPDAAAAVAAEGLLAYHDILHTAR